MSVDQLASLFALAKRALPDTQRAKRKRDVGPELSMIEADEFEAAAAEIAHHAVRPGNAGDDAEGGELRFLGAGEDTHGRAAAPAHGGGEFGPVLGVAHGRRRQQIETL